MKRLESLKKLAARLWPWLIILGIVGAVALSQPVLWPGGFGIREGKSIITSVEKDQQGKITKTVETTKLEPGKTLWDWLSLLGVPLTLAILGFWLQQLQQHRAEKLAEEQRELASNETKEEVLQAYFDRLSVLLIDKNLLAIAAKINTGQPGISSTATDEEKELLNSAIGVIRARTLSILRRFEKDVERKTSVIRFLVAADIVSRLKLSLRDADLNCVNLSGADLNRTFFDHVDFSGANLSGADLSGAFLDYADLRGANLSGADLSGAFLNYTDFSSADLSEADFAGANLSNTKLTEAVLTKATYNIQHTRNRRSDRYLAPTIFPPELDTEDKRDARGMVEKNSYS
jgi:uncharacterized protein YjbI with pentapeptide repeats